MSFFDSRNLPEGVIIDREEVAKIAYFKWLAAGCPHGNDQEFWFRAETEYARMHGLWDWDEGPFQAVETVDGTWQKATANDSRVYPAPWRDDRPKATESRASHEKVGIA
jgi:hypothetical protein